MYETRKNVFAAREDKIAPHYIEFIRMPVSTQYGIEDCNGKRIPVNIRTADEAIRVAEAWTKANGINAPFHAIEIIKEQQ